MDVTILTDKAVKVRKPHKCLWCPEVISKGEVAQFMKTILDGQFCEGWLHPECSDAMEKSDIAEGYFRHDYKRGMTDDETEECRMKSRPTRFKFIAKNALTDITKP